MWCSVWRGPCCVNQSGYRDWGMSTRDVMFSVNRACCVNQSGYRDWGMSTRDVMFSVNWACSVNQSGYRVWGMSTRDVMFSVNRALLCESIWLQSLRNEHQGCDVQSEQGLAVWINLVTESEEWAPRMWCSEWTGPCCVNQSGYRVWGMSTRDVMFSVNRALLCESIWLQSLRNEHQGCEESNKARTWGPHYKI